MPRVVFFGYRDNAPSNAIISPTVTLCASDLILH